MGYAEWYAYHAFTMTFSLSNQRKLLCSLLLVVKLSTRVRDSIFIMFFLKR